MSDFLLLFVAMLAGFLLGALFFGGLWWTVHKGIQSENPAFWFLGSLLLRTGLVLAGFYFGSQGHWSKFVAYLLGFIVARVFVVKWLATKPPEPLTSTARETHVAT